MEEFCLRANNQIELYYINNKYYILIRQITYIKKDERDPKKDRKKCIPQTLKRSYYVYSDNNNNNNIHPSSPVLLDITRRILYTYILPLRGYAVVDG